MSRLLTPTSAAAVDPVAALQRLPTDGDDAPARLVPGTRLFVEVIAPLPDGGVRARALDGSGDYRLAFNAPPGTRLEVTVSEDEAPPAFPLLAKEAHGAISSISNAGRLVAALAPNAENGARPAIVVGKMPLLAEPAADAGVLVRALAHALAGSGLFYEAHQAQWVSGARPRELLLEEPQARLTLREVRSHGSHREPSPLDDRAAAQTAATLDGAPRSAADLDSVVHRRTVPLVQQQLAALETGAILWRGELWRGQPIEWEVRRDDARGERREPASEGIGSWSTRLRLILPVLGAVEARLAIDAHGINLRIAANEPASADILRANMNGLAAAMGQAGLNVRRMEVQHVA